MDVKDDWIGRSEVLARLRVKSQTLYAYVSRGRIAARPDPTDPRRSLYSLVDVERLVRGETGPSQAPRAMRGEAEAQSSQTAAREGRLFYRGMDAVQLARQATLEDVARRLWQARDSNPFAPLKPRLDSAGGAGPRGRFLAALARRAGEEPPSTDRPMEDLTAEAARAVDEALDALAGPGPRLFLHQRLARGWKLREKDADLVRRALVLGADEPADAAVLTARTAASGGASVAAAALAGLVTFVASPLMRRTVAASHWVGEVRADPVGAARRARESERDLGFGHDAAWPQGDPRAAALLDAVAWPRDIEAVRRETEDLLGGLADFPLALALLARALDLPREAAADLLLAARTVGLIGHVLDQRRSGSPIRARLRYVGPEPGAH